jgi:hypothetical protein
LGDILGQVTVADAAGGRRMDQIRVTSGKLGEGGVVALTGISHE